jgi:hypothetical protein
MRILSRLKKKFEQGFKEFVLNLETTTFYARAEILTLGILEDPIYMGHVMKNIKSFSDFVNLPKEDLLSVIKSNEQIIPLMSKCLYKADDRLMSVVESSLGPYIKQINEEVSFIKDLPQKEKEAAEFFILKQVRKSTQEGMIRGFSWNLPPDSVYRPLTLNDGFQKIYFPNGIVAAEGEVSLGKRVSGWKHYYDNRALLAEGGYEQDLKSGEWVFFYGNGKLKTKGKFISDLKHGTWIEWDRAGNQKVVEYNQGVRKKN